MVNKAVIKRLLRDLNTCVDGLVDLPDCVNSAHVRKRIVGGKSLRKWIERFGGAGDCLPSLESGYHPMLFLVNEGCEASEQIVSTLSEIPILKDKVGIRRIREELDALIVYASWSGCDEKTLKEVVRAVLVELGESIQHYQVIVPIENLALSGMDTLEVGQVTFCSTESSWGGVQSDIITSIFSGAIEEQRAPLEDYFHKRLEPVFAKQRCFAKIVVEAEIGHAKELAYKRLNDSLNLLRCYTHMFCSREMRVHIGMNGEGKLTQRPVLVLPKAGTRWAMSDDAVGSLNPFFIRADQVAALSSEFAFDKLKAILASSSNDRNMVQNSIVAAVSWFGRSADCDNPLLKVLFCAIGFETLFLGEGNKQGGLRESFAITLAFLLESKPDDRRRLYRWARKLYRVRSEVAHKGNSETGDISQDEIAWNAARALAVVARNADEWDTHEKIREHVDRLMFGESLEQ